MSTRDTSSSTSSGHGQVAYISPPNSPSLSGTDPNGEFAVPLDAPPLSDFFWRTSVRFEPHYPESPESCPVCHSCSFFPNRICIVDVASPRAGSIGTLTLDALERPLAQLDTRVIGVRITGDIDYSVSRLDTPRFPPLDAPWDRADPNFVSALDFLRGRVPPPIRTSFGPDSSPGPRNPIRYPPVHPSLSSLDLFNLEPSYRGLDPNNPEVEREYRLRARVSHLMRMGWGRQRGLRESPVDETVPEGFRRLSSGVRNRRRPNRRRLWVERSPITSETAFAFDSDE